jgi:hypothetical protein
LSRASELFYKRTRVPSSYPWTSLQRNHNPSAKIEMGKSKSAYMGEAVLDYHHNIPVDGTDMESMRAFTLIIWDSVKVDEARSDCRIGRKKP